MKNKLSLLLVSFFLFSCAENKQVTEQQTTFCNPMNLDYGWGCFQKREKKARTAADPVIVLFKDKYYLFTTMDIGGYRVSDDLITWKDVYFNPEIHASVLDIYHYVAPAVAADDNYVYFINFTRDRSKKKVAHVGIYLKNGKFIHSSTSRGVIVSRLGEDYYSRHWICGGRIR